MKQQAIDINPYLSPGALHLIIMPTEQCNLRCTYCYEDFALSRMAPETVRGLIRLIESRAPDLEMLSLDWFGGEPLLAQDIVEQVQERSSRLALRYTAMTVRGSMTSTEMPSAANSDAAASAWRTIRASPTTVTAFPSRMTRARPNSIS